MNKYQKFKNRYYRSCLWLGTRALKVAYIFDIPGLVAYKLVAYKKKSVYGIRGCAVYMGGFF